MSWPDMVYRPQDPNADDMGMVPFKPPADMTALHGEKEGLPKGWRDQAKGLDRTTVWEVEGNPLFEAAAGAVGVDYNELIERINTEIGPEDLYERQRLPRDIRYGTFDGREFVFDEEAIGPNYRDESHDWGITHGDIEDDLDSMMDWLVETVGDAEDQKGYSGSGPSAKDWGYEEGNIWTILGLDKPPEGSQPLDESYFKYKDSPDNYDVPKEYTAGNPWIDAGVWIGEYANTNFKETREFYDSSTGSMKPASHFNATENVTENTTENTTVEE